jgi:sugar (pentulose or hexulose) kinase
MGRYLMALDAGIGGGRCVVFDTQGQGEACPALRRFSPLQNFF